MVMFTGAGILPVLFVLAAFIASSAVDGRSVPGVRPPHLWPFMIAAALASFALGKFLNRDGVKHTIYDCRMEYSAFAILGLIVLVEVLMRFSPARAQ